MTVTQRIIHYRLSPEGGALRKLSLFSMSCVAYGYGTLIREIRGISYGPIGALGVQHGWQTFFAIHRIARRISAKMRRDRRWVERTRLRAKKACLSFADALHALAPIVATNPERFMRFALRYYPRYMSAIGVYNLYWRYLEFAGASFPSRGLRQLGIERNRLADIYPRYEHMAFQAMKELGARWSCQPQYLLMMTRSEMARSLASSRLAVPLDELRKRSHGYVYLFVRHREFVSSSRSEVVRLQQYERAQYQEHISEHLRGRSMQPGRVIGTVVLQKNKRIWPRNAIYVVANTHPAELPYLKKAVAIVTDEGGGILSHAAIVARELKIPCVIGTKVATRVFKDGDVVEVDANRGIVRRLR